MYCMPWNINGNTERQAKRLVTTFYTRKRVTIPGHAHCGGVLIDHCSCQWRACLCGVLIYSTKRLVWDFSSVLQVKRFNFEPHDFAFFHSFQRCWWNSPSPMLLRYFRMDIGTMHDISTTCYAVLEGLKKRKFTCIAQSRLEPDTSLCI